MSIMPRPYIIQVGLRWAHNVTPGRLRVSSFTQLKENLKDTYRKWRVKAGRAWRVRRLWIATSIFNPPCGGEGEDHAKILRLLSSESLINDSRNNCLHLLRDMNLGDTGFGVFPLWGSNALYPWFATTAEGCNYILQTLESLAFLHEHLIAHGDICENKLLINHVVDPRGPPEVSWSDLQQTRHAWRSLFPRGSLRQEDTWIF